MEQKPWHLDWEVFTLDKDLAAAKETDGERQSLAIEALANAARVQPSSADVAAAVAAALANARVSASGAGAGTGGSTVTATMTAPSTITFNCTALPTDVRKRCVRRCDEEVILKSQVTNPCASGNMCCLDGTNRLIPADGLLFVASLIPDEKNLLRNPITCKDDSHQGA